MITASPSRSPHHGEHAASRHRELVERVGNLVPVDGAITPLAGLTLRRASAPTEIGHGLSSPALCVIAQGRKEIRYGDRSLWYDPEHFLVVSTAMPFATRIAQASMDEPYLGIVLDLDPVLVGSVMVEAGYPARIRAGTPAIDVSPLPGDLLDPVVRLIRLLDSPADQHFLAPLVKREIVYRLLMGEQGHLVRHVASLGGDTNRITQAITRLREEFDRPLSIEALAGDLGMSVSSFHQHFKQVTALSPLQFQKQLRLQEARRLMLGEDLDATSAGLRVGYDDASHFSRDYKRLFGQPPMRDAERLRGVPAGLSELKA